MTIRVAINGYGRIGRNILRAHYEDGKKHDIQIVAINDLGDPKTNAHLTRYDTAHGRFPGTVTVSVISGPSSKAYTSRATPVSAAKSQRTKRKRETWSLSKAVMAYPESSGAPRAMAGWRGRTKGNAGHRHHCASSMTSSRGSARWL